MSLSNRQERIFSFIQMFTVKNGYPPSIREICIGTDISSTSVANYNLNILKRKGYIYRNKTVARGIKIVAPSTVAHITSIPLLGHIAAGQPIDVPDSAYPCDNTISVSSDLVKSENVYALKVKGTSMIDAFVNDGDIVIIKPISSPDDGDMVVVWLTDREETTLKRFYHEGKHVRLQPENATMKPIYVNSEVVQVQGKVVAVLRHLN